VHPDRHAHLPETERRLSMQWATQVNEAYRTLKKPLLRAHYLLRLAGAETDHESNTAMPPRSSWSRWSGARRWPRRARPATTTSWKS
jgi:DnaJ-domain-containing protein 1